MIHTGKLQRMEVYHNIYGETPEQIKAKTGCSTIFNGVLFNGDGSLCCDNRFNGRTISNDRYAYYGYAWNRNEAPIMISSETMEQYDNFISCLCGVYNGVKQQVNDNDRGIGGTRGRTAIGFKKDRTFVVLCTSDNNGAMKLSQVRDKLYDMGCVDVLILDGGGSSYLDCPTGKVDTSYNRKKYNRTYILLWEQTERKKGGDKVKKGIDVSEHQGVINWDTVKPQIDFVMIRAGYGRNNIDKQFVRNINECNRLGIPCGIYWFSYALTAEDAKQEARYCLNAIKDYKVELPIAFDLEYDSVDYAKRNGIVIGQTLATAMLKAFCEEIENAGYFAMMYANGDYINRYFNESLTQRFALWYACLTSAANFNNPPRECGIWQHSFTGRINGINGNVDLNVDYKDFANWIKELGLNHLGDIPTTPETPVKPEPEPEPEKPWYYEAQKWVKKNKIADGKDPDGVATRAQVWQMLYNAMGE